MGFFLCINHSFEHVRIYQKCFHKFNVKLYLMNEYVQMKYRKANISRIEFVSVVKGERGAERVREERDNSYVSMGVRRYLFCIVSFSFDWKLL